MIGRTKVLMQIFAFFGVVACVVIALRVFHPSAAFQIQSLMQLIKKAERNVDGNTVTKLNIYRSYSEQENFTRAVLKYLGGSAAMYVFDTRDSISRTIIESGCWECDAINSMERYLMKNPEVHLIDIGSNLGMYTLAAALWGRRVVAVEVNMLVIRRLRKSVIENKLDNLVTIVNNAVSNKYANLTIYFDYPRNVGGAGVIVPGSYLTNILNAQSVYMDDLLQIIDFKKAILKMDIEGHEYQALQKSTKLFQEIDIYIVIFEWGEKGRLEKKEVAEFYLEFFLSRGFKPYTALIGGSLLDPTKYKTWPWDIYWRKYE